MPELPEVETITRELIASELIGATIAKAQVFWPNSLAEMSTEQFSKELCGQKILKIERRAKFIVFTLQNYSMLVHLRMTGKLLFTSLQTPSAHERLRLTLDDGRQLCYEDQRKFGKWYLVKDPHTIVGTMGLEPLSKQFTLHAFIALLQKSTMQIKPFLLNQHFVAGIGNIYADEALWQAKIHPQTAANVLNKNEQEALFRAIPDVLTKGLENQGTTLGNLHANYFSVNGRRGTNQHQLQVFRREKLPCPRCQTPIVKIVVQQRGTHLCPKCQKPARA